MADNSHDDIFLNAMQEQEENTDDKNAGLLKEGTVVAVTESDVFLDMGGKAEVLVSREEFTEVPSVGDSVKVVPKGMKDGVHRASKKGAEKLAKQEEIQTAFRDELPVKGTLKSVVMKDGTPRGYNVELGPELSAFLPLSQSGLRKGEDPESLVGKTYDMAVTEARRGSFIVSRREYNRKTRKKLFEAFFENHEVGDVIEGKADEISQNFMIVDVDGVKAFMHISDFSWKYLTDLRKIVKEGDEIKAEIIQMDKSRDSVKISQKAVMPDPWQGIESRISIGDVVNAKVVRFRRSGAVIEVEDGIEAFLPVEELSWTKKVRDPKHVLKRGMIVEVKVKSVSEEDRKMDVSLRDMQENPWHSAGATYSRGRKLHGVVTSITDFGVFIKFEDGIEGLLRAEDVDWLDGNVDLKERFKKGDEVDVVVLNIDPGRERLRLGIKQLSDNPLKTFNMNYPKGAVVEAPVAEVNDNGVVVTLQDGLTGFIHISQLAKENVENPADLFSVGDKMTAVVRYTDVERGKIELSRKDYLYNEEKLEVQKYMVQEDTTDDSSTMSMGSILKNQLEGFDLGDDSDSDE